ncbi:ABC transporter permease [Tepidiforma flava]|uniref:ABC transporter permease n=1 Tax=Tepidiforma flava TaxID=3004094 RepID=A0ABY7M3W4_9CHLR|nr:ABC transporter permease [Tepidiforma flava]WBL35243.1 ABC transporter permease [Tepidiforma flava]
MFALIVAIPIGVISAVRQDSALDYVLRVLSIGLALSIPGFWLGTMLIVFPAKWWGYAPPVGYVDIWEDPLKNLEQLYLPAISLGLALSASLARVTRSSMLEVFRQDYIRTARAKGLRERMVVFRHALQNAMIPVVTLFGLQFGVLLGGTVVLENIYSLPGLGLLTFTSVTIKDYPQVQGLVLFFAAVLVTINLLVDLSYAWFDPRIRYVVMSAEAVSAAPAITGALPRRPGRLARLWRIARQKPLGAAAGVVCILLILVIALGSGCAGAAGGGCGRPGEEPAAAAAEPEPPVRDRQPVPGHLQPGDHREPDFAGHRVRGGGDRDAAGGRCWGWWPWGSSGGGWTCW